jgi:hypothetical protein
MKTVVAIVIAAAAIAATIDPEHTFHRAHRATDTCSDRAADHATHGTGNPVTFTGASWAPRTMPCALPAWGIASRARTIAATAKWNFRGKPAGSGDVLTAIVFIFVFI